MPLWDDYKQHASERGALAFELFVVVSTPARAPEDVQASLPDHLSYQSRLESEGALVFAGPLSGETGTQMQGKGMIIYRAATMEDARALAEADPMHKSGARSFTLRKWLVNEGSLGINVRLSGQNVSLS